MENITDLKPKKEKSQDVPKWTDKNVKESGFYLLRGKHRFYTFHFNTALVDVEKNKVYMFSQHCGYDLDKMFSTGFLGPFYTKEELLDARNKEIARNNR